jgi:hypothetical protein
VSPVITRDFVPSDGDYTRLRSVVDSRNVQLDPNIRSPHTDEYSVGVDRELGHSLAMGLTLVRKEGADFIGWTEAGGRYVQGTEALPDGSELPVFRLVPGSPARLFQLTNPESYFLTYNGLVAVITKRRSNGWQVSGSYTWSRARGMQPSSGTTAAGEQISTVGAPPILFGRDPNDLTNAVGRLPNDRPHMAQASGTVDVPHTGVVISGRVLHESGKPWAAATRLVTLPAPQTQQRVLIESRGSRRLSSQTLLDMRVSRTISFGGRTRVDLMMDVFNLLNDAAEEGLVTDERFSPNFGQPNLFVDPRRIMFGVQLRRIQ